MSVLRRYWYPMIISKHIRRICLFEYLLRDHVNHFTMAVLLAIRLNARLLLLVWLYVLNYDDVIMTMLASQITSLTVVCSIVYSGVNQRKHQSSASLAFVREIHRGPVNFPHKWPVTRKMFPFDDVIMNEYYMNIWECNVWLLISFIWLMTNADYIIGSSRTYSGDIW